MCVLFCAVMFVHMLRTFVSLCVQDPQQSLSGDMTLPMQLVSLCLVSVAIATGLCRQDVYNEDLKVIMLLLL